jgi:hypothetical protein
VQGELAPATVCNIGGGKAGCMSYGGIDAGTTCVILFYLREYLMHITRQEACMAYHLVVRDEVQLISLAKTNKRAAAAPDSSNSIAPSANYGHPSCLQRPKGGQIYCFPIIMKLER